MQYDRYRKFSIKEVHDLYNKYAKHEENGTYHKKYHKKKTEIEDGVFVNMDSQRYQVFFETGFDCIECGLRGVYFWLERDMGQSGNVWHFNLYGISDSGEEVRMTKHRIVPKAKGGKDIMSNYQPMCEHCNKKKSGIK